MKNMIIPILACFLLTGCGSSFQGFYNNHKNDIGVTSFQLPNFVKAVIGNVSPEVSDLVGNIADLKYMKFENPSPTKRLGLIQELSDVTNHGYIDMFRKNEESLTRMVSVKELGVILTDVILFKSSETETTAFYLKGKFDPEKVKALSDEEKFDDLSKQLQLLAPSSLTPGFNPNN